MTLHSTRRAASTVVSSLVVGLLVAGLIGVAGSSALAGTASAQTAAPDPGDYQALTPTRILDTRSGIGAPVARVQPSATLALTVLGRGGIPSAGVSAVVFNLTVVDPVTNGYVSAYPAGTSTPPTSSLNFAAGETRAHLVVVAPGSAGQVALLNGSGGAADLLADVVGFYNAGTPTAGGEFGVLTPARILDTRTGLGDPQPTEFGGINIQVTGRGGVPSSGVSSVVLNLTATRATRAGYLSATVNGYGFTSSVNFRAGQSASNLVVIPVSPTGTITVWASVGPVDEVADVLGYFAAGSPAADDRLGGVNPGRLLDTRKSRNPIPAFGTVSLQVAGQQRVPSAGITAAALNVTVASPGAAGYLTTYQSGAARPTASTVNFARATVANLVLAPLGSDGSIRIYNGSAVPVQVVVDVSAFVGPIPGPLSWSGRATIPGATAVDQVSCGSASFCMAFDDDSAYRYDGHSWSTATTLVQYVQSASCVAPGFCIALTSGGPYVFDGGRWSPSPFPGAPDALAVISCTSSTFCVALAGSNVGDVAITSWVFDGTSWSTVATGSLLSYTRSLSCGSPTFCVAVDDAGDSARFDGTSWAALPTAGLTDPGTVSCTSATFCMAANDGQAVRFDGAHWSTPTTLDVQTSLTDSISTVSCTSATFCLAATGFGYQLLWSGTTWSTAFDVDPAAVNLQRLSCAVPQFCTVVDASGAVVGS